MSTEGRSGVDLFEYQARDMLEKHGVPVLRGIVATTPAEARAAAEQLGGGTVVVKAQVKTGGRGKAGGVKLAHNPEETEARASEILGMDIKGHTVHRVMIAEGAKIAEEYYFSVLLDRSERRYLAMASVEGGMEIEQLAVERPEALARVAVDPLAGIDEAKAAEIVAQAGFAPEVADEVAAVIQKLLDRLRRGGRHARRGQPARAHRGRRDRRAGRQGLPRRQRRLPPRRARRARGQGGRRPARGQGQGPGAQLRQARRRGRHHRQRRGPGHVHPRRRRLRRRGARRAAGELPRHRRRRQRRDHGERPGRHPRRPAGEVGLRQRLRRHHRLRRGRQRHRQGAGDPRRARRPSRSWCAWTATTSRRAAGSSREANHPLVTMADTMDGAAAKAAELAAAK